MITMGKVTVATVYSAGRDDTSTVAGLSRIHAFFKDRHMARSDSMTVADHEHESGSIFFLMWAMAAAFGAYFCMYGFRKPFTAGTYADAAVWGIGFKTILVTSQVAGYMLSKFIGIKVIAEMPSSRRAFTMIWLILMAEGALILFGVLPRPWNAACLFFNGLPLGMVFGLVLGYLEGRRATELLTAGLCTSFILADGVTKSVGAWLLARGVPEDWMPSAAGAVFLLPFGLCVMMLSRIASPTPQDVAARSERSAMGHTERRGFFLRHVAGLVPLILLYLLVTIVRSIRADFAPEIWRDLQHTTVPSTFTSSEMIVAFLVLMANGAAILIRDNRRAFFTSLATCAVGLGLLAIALPLRANGTLDGFTFMVLLGLGLYLPYVAFHTTVFERLLGMTRERGNIGFLMYLADSIGYLGYVSVMIGRNFGSAPEDVLGLLTTTCWIAVILGCVCVSMSAWYFLRAVHPMEGVDVTLATASEGAGA